MKFAFQAVLLAASVAAAALVGCSTEPKVLYHAGDENPPAFVAGPMAFVWTNVDGFSAKITGTVTGGDGIKHTVAGDFLGREGSVIFQPANKVKGRRARSEGGTFFIWSETRQEGYVLSDPLQAYAPAATKAQPTNVVLKTSTGAEEFVNSHRCRRQDVVVESSDGSKTQGTIWEAEDARHFPVRIVAGEGPGAMEIDLSNIRLELPQPQLFAPPDGFTKYGSPVALMNELITRQSVFAKKDFTPVENDAPAGAQLNNWRPTTPQ